MMNLFSTFFMILFLNHAYSSHPHAYGIQALDSSFSFLFENDSVIIGLDSIGTFEGNLYNHSNSDIALGIVRTMDFNNEGWSSSMCIDALCYNQTIDSISAFVPIGQSTVLSVLAWTNGQGSDQMQLEIFELNNFSNRITIDIDFILQSELKFDNDYLFSNHAKILSLYPNPFNPHLKIDYKIVRDSEVELIIYNLLGKRVISLLDTYQKPGEYSIKWNGRDALNKRVASGSYFIVIGINGVHSIKKITFLE